MTKTFERYVKLQAVAAIICMASALPGYGQCEVAQLIGSNGLGFVATDVDIAVVGDVQAFNSFGAAFVFRRGPDGLDDWAVEATLMSPDPNTSEIFGRAVAVSGDVIVVSALSAQVPDFQMGAVYIYRYDDGISEWRFETTLIASDGDMGDLFGYSVAIDGNVVIIGARDDENDGISHSGSAYIFRYDLDIAQWVEEAKLVDPNSEEFDLLGVSASISADIAIVGAHGNEDAGSGTGAAFIFRYDSINNPGKWILEQQLQAVDAQWQAWFGFSVSLQGDSVVIGAPQLDSQTGAAYVMRFNGKQWIHEAKLLAANPSGPFPLMGTGVSISKDGNTVLSGAPLDDGAGNESGAVHLFRNEAGKWSEIIKLTPSDGGPGQDFGESLALNGDVALIKGGDVGSSKAYIFAGIQDIDCNDNGEPDACDIFDGQSNDQNNNGIPDECDEIQCPWDLDKNGIVSTSDLLELFSQWGAPGTADFDASGAVGTADLLIMFANWGSCML